MLNKQTTIRLNRAVIYCRVSTQEQVEEGNSLFSQERICREYAIRMGYEIVEVFIEKGESAKTDDRTELTRLRAFCSLKRNAIGVVVFYKIDRWARYLLDYSNLRAELNRTGIIIRSATEHFEDNPAGRFLENVLASQAQFDNEVRAERCAGGMKDAVREGRYVWAAPIGYENIKMAGKATIGLSAEAAPLMRRTFQLAASNNYPIEEVRRRMEQQGLRNKNGKPLSKAYFYRLLTNELYAGWIRKFGERVKGTFEPIVSEEIFNQVQRVLKHKGRLHTQHRTDHPDFPLRRFVMNPDGKKLTGCWSKGARKRYPYYRFLGKGASYSRDWLTGLFMAHMDKYALCEEHYQQLLRFIRKHLLKADQDRLKDGEFQQKRIATLTEKQSALVQKNLAGVISDSVLSQQLTLLEKELMDAHGKLMAQEGQQQTDLEEAVLYLKPYFKSPSKIWLNSETARKLALQKFEFPSGLVFDGKSFRTPELSSFFKVKQVLDAQKSSTVDSGFEKSNRVRLPNSIIEIEDFAFWNDFKHQVRQAYIITKEPGTPP